MAPFAHFETRLLDQSRAAPAPFRGALGEACGDVEPGERVEVDAPDGLFDPA